MVPLPRDCELFVAVARLGGELVRVHLMESELPDDAGGKVRYPVEGESVVEKGQARYDAGGPFDKLRTGWAGVCQ